MVYILQQTATDCSKLQLDCHRLPQIAQTAADCHILQFASIYSNLHQKETFWGT